MKLDFLPVDVIVFEVFSFVGVGDLTQKISRVSKLFFKLSWRSLKNRRIRGSDFIQFYKTSVTNKSLLDKIFKKKVVDVESEGKLIYEYLKKSVLSNRVCIACLLRSGLEIQENEMRRYCGNFPDNLSFSFVKAWRNPAGKKVRVITKMSVRKLVSFALFVDEQDIYDATENRILEILPELPDSGVYDMIKRHGKMFHSICTNDLYNSRDDRLIREFFASNNQNLPKFDPSVEDWKIVKDAFRSDKLWLTSLFFNNCPSIKLSSFGNDHFMNKRQDIKKFMIKTHSKFTNFDPSEHRYEVFKKTICQTFSTLLVDEFFQWTDILKDLKENDWVEILEYFIINTKSSDNVFVFSQIIKKVFNSEEEEEGIILQKHIQSDLFLLSLQHYRSDISRYMLDRMDHIKSYFLSHTLQTFISFSSSNHHQQQKNICNHDFLEFLEKKLIPIAASKFNQEHEKENEVTRYFNLDFVVFVIKQERSLSLLRFLFKNVLFMKQIFLENYKKCLQECGYERPELLSYLIQKQCNDDSSQVVESLDLGRLVLHIFKSGDFYYENSTDKIRRYVKDFGGDISILFRYLTEEVYRIEEEERNNQSLIIHFFEEEEEEDDDDDDDDDDELLKPKYLKVLEVLLSDERISVNQETYDTIFLNTPTGIEKILDFMIFITKIIPKISSDIFCLLFQSYQEKKSDDRPLIGMLNMLRLDIKYGKKKKNNKNRGLDFSEKDSRCNSVLKDMFGYIHFRVIRILYSILRHYEIHDNDPFCGNPLLFPNFVGVFVGAETTRHQMESSVCSCCKRYGKSHDSKNFESILDLLFRNKVFVGNRIQYVYEVFKFRVRENETARKMIIKAAEKYGFELDVNVIGKQDDYGHLNVYSGNESDDMDEFFDYMFY